MRDPGDAYERNSRKTLILRDDIVKFVSCDLEVSNDIFRSDLKFSSGSVRWIEGEIFGKQII